MQHMTERPTPVGASVPRSVRLAVSALAVAALVSVTGCSAAALTQSPTDAPTAATSAAPAVSAVPSPTASPSPRPSSPTQSSATATVTFNELTLDSSTDTTAKLRTFTFSSDGPGVVSIQVVSSTMVSSTRLCLAVDSAAQQCRAGVTPSFADEVTATAHSTWTVTLASADEGTPTVDLTLSWPAAHPTVTATNGRFQGSPNPDALRSFTATFRTRAAGQMSLEAAWTPGAANATLTLTKEPSSGASVNTVKYAGVMSVAPAYSHSVDAASTYRLTLMNDSANNGRTGLTATIAFP